MLTHHESRKLQVEMRRELEEPAHTVWKCAAGLLFLAALVLTGAGSVTSPESGGYATAQAGTHR